MVKVTANELAELLKIDYVTASAIAKLMVAQGKGKLGEPRPQPNGKGKPSNVYELDDEFTLKLK